MRGSIAGAVLLLGGLVATKECVDLQIPIAISARQGKLDIVVPATTLEAITFGLNNTKQGSNFTDVALQGYQTVVGRYELSAQYCFPNTKADLPVVVQILTHGIGFDKTYWDLPYNSYNYSYTDVAVDEYGYHTLAFDRLGVGNSSHGDPLNEIQAPLEVAALGELTRLVRGGNVAGMPDRFEKIVHVGHSFGSIQTYWLTAADPTISDGIILTGFGVNQSFVGDYFAGANFDVARLNQPRLAGVGPGSINYGNGYVITSDIGANVYGFFLPGAFDEGILHYSEANKQPATVGEFMTLGGAPHSNNFTCPVLVITGSDDLPFCGGDCLNTGDPQLPSIPAGAKQVFPNIAPENFRAVIQPNTGHGLNFHYNATAGYRVVNDFVKEKIH